MRSLEVFCQDAHEGFVVELAVVQHHRPTNSLFDEPGLLVGPDGAIVERPGLQLDLVIAQLAER